MAQYHRNEETVAKLLRAEATHRHCPIFTKPTDVGLSTRFGSAHMPFLDQPLLQLIGNNI